MMGMGMGMGLVDTSIATEAVLLVALGLGYVVCYFAKQEEKEFKTIGLLIGGFVIVMSLILIIANLLTGIKKCNMMGGPMMQRPMMRHNMMQTPYKAPSMPPQIPSSSKR